MFDFDQTAKAVTVIILSTKKHELEPCAALNDISSQKKILGGGMLKTSFRPNAIQPRRDEA